MSQLSKILKIAEERERGPLPTFVQPHLLLVLMITGGTKSIGRQALARRTGLGEGSIRTILKRLRDDGYIRADASGCSLTATGRDAHEQLKKRIPKMLVLGATSLTVGNNQVAILVRGAGRDVTNGIEQRDAAIKVWATGATTYLLHDSKFQIPRDSKDCENDFPGPIWGRLRRELAPVDGDVIIVCGSASEVNSTVGALSAAITLIG